MGMLPMEYDDRKITHVDALSRTFTTANTITYAGSFTLEKDAIVKVSAPYSNGSPTFVGIGAGNTTATIVARNERGSFSTEKSGMSCLAMLSAGTYYNYVAYDTANVTNTITIDAYYLA